MNGKSVRIGENVYVEMEKLAAEHGFKPAPFVNAVLVAWLKERGIRVVPPPSKQERDVEKIERDIPGQQKFPGLGILPAMTPVEPRPVPPAPPLVQPLTPPEPAPVEVKPAPPPEVPPEARPTTEPTTADDIERELEGEAPF